MIRTFTPRFDALPPAQQHLWPELHVAPKLGFTLYGGTAIALRLGHRSSVDFDFFSDEPLDHDAVRAAVPFAARSTTLRHQANTWVLLVPIDDTGRMHVKVSFFGAITFGRVGEPEFTDDGVLQVASLDDLMATKVKTVLQRAEVRDYRDIAAMIHAGVSLPHGIAAARVMFGPNFQPIESLKALVYFDDGDLSRLTAAERTTLVDAVKAAGDLPEVVLRSLSLGGLGRGGE